MWFDGLCGIENKQNWRFIGWDMKWVLERFVGLGVSLNGGDFGDDFPYFCKSLKFEINVENFQKLFKKIENFRHSPTQL